MPSIANKDPISYVDSTSYLLNKVAENLTTEPQLPYPAEELDNLEALHIGRDPDFEMTDDNIDKSAEYTSLHGPEIPFEQSEASPRDHREGTSLEADEDVSDSEEDIHDSSTSSKSVPLGLSLQYKDNDYCSELLQENLEQDVNSRMKEFIRVVARELQKLRDVDDLTEDSHQSEKAVTSERIFGAESSMPEEQVKSGDNVGVESPKDVITQFTPNIIVKVPLSGSYVTLRHEDLKKLKGGDSPESKYLNDNLLMAGIWLWYDRLAKTRPGLSEDVVVLDSTLSNAIQGVGSGNHKEAFHRAVKNKAIFGAQYLIVPMHASQMEHWYIIVVFFPGKFISSMEEEGATLYFSIPCRICIVTATPQRC
ncbi:hypothetical protein PHLGIDRAFT_123145 [Phlebiopsis gigantea 11061_1 CR5-6]|uniref:Ubiquitin-like protease family profile domain-containing protein n=1 Tax=Phlebiopsis gigantea (strain 11061_1 CR5-6) TaxID=745531 RepID=A0A0C3PA75_PHLG1|nr:hypothetical protein PHLGIDRAFT_123145 [Phlebiopsis gigantea 11061_1 CR5-6]